VIIAADHHWGGSWGDNDTILITTADGDLLRVDAASGSSQTVPRSTEAEYGWPELLPGAEEALITVRSEMGSHDDDSIAVVSLRDGALRVLMESGYNPAYSPTGHLLFVQGRTVRAAPFDLEQLTLQGPAITVLDDVWASPWTGYADFAVARTGAAVYISGGADPNLARLMDIDRAGNLTPVLDERRAYRLPRVDPAGQRIALTLAEDQVDIWSFDRQRNSLERVTDSASWDGYAIWRPGVDSITFSSMRDGPFAAIFSIDLVSEAITPLVSHSHAIYSSSWSGDGTLLAYWEENPQTGLDIWVYSSITEKSEPFLVTSHNEERPEFSRDGRFIAYVSNETGEQREVYVRPYPSGNPGRRISTAGGLEPRWNRSGTELYYRVGEALMAVGFDPASGQPLGPPQPVATGPFGTAYDLVPDGTSFIVLQERSPGDPPIRVSYIGDWSRSFANR